MIEMAGKDKDSLTLAVKLGSDSYRRGGGGNLAAPVSDFVFDEVSSNRRSTVCHAGTVEEKTATATGHGPRCGEGEDSSSEYDSEVGQDAYFDISFNEWNEDCTRALSLSPTEDYTSLYLESPTPPRSDGGTEEQACMRLKGGMEQDPPPDDQTSLERTKTEQRPAGGKPGPKSSKKKMNRQEAKTGEASSIEIADVAMDDTCASSVSSVGTSQRGKTKRSKTKTCVISSNEGDSDEPPEKAPRGRKLTSVDRPLRTTGLYAGRAEAIRQVNLEKDKSLQLEREAALRGLDKEALLKDAKINIEKVKEGMEDDPTEELADKVSRCSLEVIRIAKTSSNLKGTYQKSLKIAAATSLSCVELLKERASKNQEGSNADEIKILRKEVSALRSRLENEVELERRKALAAEARADFFRQELDKLKREIGTRETQKGTTSPRLPSSPRKTGLTRQTNSTNVADTNSRNKKQTPKSDFGMEVDDPNPEEKVVLPPREEWPPAIRPSIQGKCKIIEDRPLHGVTYKIGRKPNLVTPKKRESKEEKNRVSTKTTKEELNTSPKSLADMIREIIRQELNKQKENPAPGPQKAAANTSDNRNKTTKVEERPIQTNAVEAWSQVVGRNARKGQAKQPPPKNAPANQSGFGAKKAGDTKTPRRVPRTAAIQISCKGERKYAEVMRVAKTQIDIDAIGITDIRPRKARTGAFLLEIPGADGATKADLLAAKLREITAGQEDILISRPEKMGEVRIRNIEESISQEDIALKVSQTSGCSVDKVSIGTITIAPNGLGTALLRCPLTVAKTISQVPRMRIGWTMVRVELLPPRTLQCFRCFEEGHVRAECKAAVDRSSLCYRCGKEGHVAKLCTALPHCAICAERGARSNHRMGGQACRPPRRGKRHAAPGVENVTLPPTKATEMSCVAGADLVSGRTVNEPATQPASTMQTPMDTEPLEGGVSSHSGAPEWPQEGTSWEISRPVAECAPAMEEKGITTANNA